MPTPKPGTAAYYHATAKDYAEQAVDAMRADADHNPDPAAAAAYAAISTAFSALADGARYAGRPLLEYGG